MALLDWEPQGSLTLWWVMRGKPDNPRLIREDVEPAEALRKLSEPTSHPTEGAVAKLIAYACLVVSGTLAAVYGYTTGNTETTIGLCARPILSSRGLSARPFGNRPLSSKFRCARKRNEYPADSIHRKSAL